jgi:hypothetical protein
MSRLEPDHDSRLAYQSVPTRTHGAATMYMHMAMASAAVEKEIITGSIPQPEAGD